MLQKDLSWTLNIDKQNPFMEFVIHVMNNEEERVKGINLLVLNIRKKPGSYEKKLSHWTKSFLDKNIKYFKEVKREEGVFVKTFNLEVTEKTFTD